MSDDFGTISINRAKFARHREALQKLAADAPTEHLANEYRRMMALVDQLELAALRAGGDPSTAKITRGNARTDEPARFRENVAEYYRRLGEKESR